MYFVRRLLATILLVVAVSSAAFIITRLAAAHAIVIELGLRLDQKEIQRRTHELKLDQPILSQWGSWLAGLTRLDLGTSVYYNSPVAPIVGDRARNTALLATIAFLTSLVIGIPPAFAPAISVRAARGASDSRHIALPAVAAVVRERRSALVMFAARTGWLPAGGLTSSVAGVTFTERAIDVVWHLPAPVLALALPLAATFERLQTQALGGRAGATVGARRARARDSRALESSGVTPAGSRSSRWPELAASPSARC